MFFYFIVTVVSNVTAAIKEYFGKFHLSAGKEEIDFGEMVPVDIDYEAFKSAKGTKQVIGSDSYWHSYSDLEELEAETGLRLWSSFEIKVSYVSLHLDDDYHTGHIGCTFVYQGKKYSMNGMFMTAERKDNWGYGTKAEPYRTYSYGDGQKTYFIKEKGYEGDEKGEHGKQIVYFTANDILYQLCVERTQEETEIAENIIDEIAKK